MKIDNITSIVGVGSIIQHGTHNDRIYLLKIAKEDERIIARELIKLGQKQGYTKLFCKVPSRLLPLFLIEGYHIEGTIPQFYRDGEDLYFMAKFLRNIRALDKTMMESLYHLMNEEIVVREYKDDYYFRRLNESDVYAMIRIYKQEFESYPIPIYDPAFVIETMRDSVQYFGAFIKDELVAVCSADIDFKNKNAEMTDFATISKHRGHGLSYRLLRVMETAMLEQQIKTLYTIARLSSLAMNRSFIKNEYRYAGTLVQNTNIGGCSEVMETMNLYYKSLVI